MDVTALARVCSVAHTGNFCASNTKTFLFKKICPCALLRDKDFYVSTIVGEITHVKSGKLNFKHRVFPSVRLSNKDVSVFETKNLPVHTRVIRGKVLCLLP